MFEPEFQVSARQSADGTVSLKVSAITHYGSRAVTTTEEVADEKLTAQLEAIFEKAVKAAREGLSKRSAKATAESVYVAGQRGEDI